MQTQRTGSDSMTQALVDAATVAGYAPSIHNTQPWRWRIARNRLDLSTDSDRLLDSTDPAALLATLSCGAALHHARIGLAAQGWHVTVTRMPDVADPGHLARLCIDGPAPVELQAVRRTRTIRLRHTDRRPVTGRLVGSDDLRAISAAARAEATLLRVLRPDQVLNLAAATSHVQETETAEPAGQAELAYWTGGSRPGDTGTPNAIPLHAPRTTLPGHHVGHHGDLPVSTGPDHDAAYAVLHGRADQPMDWLRAGEALSSAWLTATELGVSVLPISAPVDVAGRRQAIRRLMTSLGHPYLVLRFGMLGTDDPGSARAPRLPAGQTIDRPRPADFRSGTAPLGRPVSRKGGGRHESTSPPAPH